MRLITITLLALSLTACNDQHYVADSDHTEQQENVEYQPHPQPNYIVGPRGPRGLRGLRGLPGQQGIKGSQGLRGKRGKRGKRGLPGIPGTNGIDGAPGLKGDKGDKGDTGDIGIVRFIHEIPDRNECVDLGGGLFVQNEGNVADVYNNDTCDHGPSPKRDICNNLEESNGASKVCWSLDFCRQFSIRGQHEDMVLLELRFCEVL